MNTELTIENVKAMTKDSKLIEVISKYLIEDAKAQVIGEEVSEIYNNLLKKFQFKVNLKSKNGKRMANSFGETITDHEKLYKNTDNHDQYYKEAHEQFLKHEGLKVYIEGKEQGYCPKLIQEHEARKLKLEALRIIKGHLKIDPDKYISLNANDKLLDMTISLLLKESK